MPRAIDSPTTIAIAAGRPNCRRSEGTGKDITHTVTSNDAGVEDIRRPKKVEKNLHRKGDDGFAPGR